MRLRLVLAVACAALWALAGAAAAETSDADVLAQLSPEQRQAYEIYKFARGSFEREHDAYWALVAAKKDERRRKRGAGLTIERDDYVIEHPPKYAGPQLRPDIAAIVAALHPAQPETPMPVVADYLEAARARFGFVPEMTTEQEFKRRYAAEALAMGLAKDQVVRIYALETGGRGTYDMQAGIDPETRRGKPISSALGYAQLLAANSVNELVKHGDAFALRLKTMAVAHGVPPARAQLLVQKANALHAMLRVARSVPNEWSEQVRLASSPQGMGVHAINLDADIGPWLQVIKLQGLRDLAARFGRPALAGAEIELMNLAGPKTGLEMMEPAALGASTANFFSQGGFYRNTIVREKSCAELLRALDERMNQNAAKAGAVEFAAIFDEVAATLPAPSGLGAQLGAYVPAPATVPPVRREAPKFGGMAVFEAKN